MRTVIDVDDEILEAAQRELGTTTKKDTVNQALRIVATRQLRLQRVLDAATRGDDNPYVSLGVGADITDAEIMAQARR